MVLKITKTTQKIERLAVKSKLVFNIASRYYRGIIKKEIALANITSGDNILCIGGGYCPFSAYLFYKATGAKVTVIDNDILCVEGAKRVVEKMGLAGGIHVLELDGSSEDLKLEEFSVIHFAVQVEPIQEVFLNIKSLAKCGQKLLIRRPKKHLEENYSLLDGDILAVSAFITHGRFCNVGKTIMHIAESNAQ